MPSTKRRHAHLAAGDRIAIVAVSDAAAELAGALGPVLLRQSFSRASSDQAQPSRTPEFVILGESFAGGAPTTGDRLERRAVRCGPGCLRRAYARAAHLRLLRLARATVTTTGTRSILSFRNSDADVRSIVTSHAILMLRSVSI